MLTIYGKIGIVLFVICSMTGIVGMAIRNLPLLWIAAIIGGIAAVLSIIETRFHKKMQKSLHDLSRQDLISIIQDYQEMVSDIEEELNSSLDERAYAKLKPKIRKVLDKYL